MAEEVFEKIDRLRGERELISNDREKLKFKLRSLSAEIRELEMAAPKRPRGGDSVQVAPATLKAG